MLYIYPTYSNLYKGELPNISDLLKGISSKPLIKLASYISAQLVLDDGKEEIQIFFTRNLLTKIPEYDKRLLSDWIATRKMENEKITIFSRFCLIELIHQILLSYNDSSETKELTLEEELNIYKAILVSNELRTISEEWNIATFLNKIEKDDEFHFQKMHWAMIVNQIDTTRLLSVFYDSFRTFCVFNSKELSIYVGNYMKCRKINSMWEFLFSFFNIYSLFSNGNQNLGNKQFGFPLKENDTYYNYALMNFLCINPFEYKSNEQQQLRYFGIKTKPLFRDENMYYVLDWNFFCEQLYIGFLFDFYNVSGIEGTKLNKKEIKSFPDFKSYLGQEVTEKSFFVPIMREIFTKKGSVILNDTQQNKNSSFPDFYVRQGKYIYVFEFKDNIMPSNIADGYDFDRIKNDIDNKFIKSANKKKALYQLSDSISQILNDSFKEYDDFENKGIKRRNLIVYPIIVYTDYKYGFSGVNDYLQKQFVKILAENSNIDRKQNIKKLTHIDFEFFFMNMLKLKSGVLSLRTLIDDYHKKIDNEVKSHSRNPDIEKFPNLYKSFEDVYYKYMPNKPEQGAIKILFDILDLAKT